MRRAIIDLGTNTTHLLIAEVQSDRVIEVLHKKRYYTFLGEDGLDHIGEGAQERLFNAFVNFSKSIEAFECSDVHILATEGLRASDNGPELKNEISRRFHWPISIISGHEESELIFEGVRQSHNLLEGKYLIMDIGGGSVEFIAVFDGKKEYQASFPIGISRLYESFHLDDPIKDSHLATLHNYLSKELSPMWSFLENVRKDISLIGCAGTFEIFISDDKRKNHRDSSFKIPVSRLEDLFQRVRMSDLNKRKLIKELPQERAQYIVVALALMKYIINMLNSESFIVSTYSMKEGAIIQTKYF